MVPIYSNPLEFGLCCVQVGLQLTMATSKDLLTRFLDLGRKTKAVTPLESELEVLDRDGEHYLEFRNVMIQARFDRSDRWEFTILASFHLFTIPKAHQ